MLQRSIIFLNHLESQRDKNKAFLHSCGAGSLYGTQLASLRLFTCSQVQINLPRSTINLIRVVKHTSLNTDHSLLRDESPSVYCILGGEDQSQDPQKGLLCFLCFHAQGAWERPSGHGVTSQCQLLFYVVLQQRSGTRRLKEQPNTRLEFSLCGKFEISVWYLQKCQHTIILVFEGKRKPRLNNCIFN